MVRRSADMTLFEKTDRLIALLRKRKAKISLAESCTGGQLSAAFSAHAGVSDVFLGSVVAYSNHLKHEFLGVESRSILQYGAVSNEVALQMARGIQNKTQSDYTIAITGIAGPGGGTAEKPVGTVWYGFVGPNFEFTSMEIFAGGRAQIQNKSVEFAIDRLFNHLMDSTSKT